MLHRDIVLNALSKYGATLTDDGFIVSKGGKPTGVRILRKSNKGKNRLLFDSNGNTLASGGFTEEFISDFVEKFWFWEKDKA